MKTLLMIFGGQAVGKMTVGEELEKRTALKLFHNHMSVELANHFYGFCDDADEDLAKQKKASFSDLRDRLRIVVFDNVAKSPLSGLIFTGAMYYDTEEVWRIIISYIDAFKNGAASVGEEVRLLAVELNCDIEERFKRNVSENRISKKPSKQNFDWSRRNIEKQLATRRIIANEADIKRFGAERFIKIDNTNISAKDVAEMISKEFNL